MIQNIYLDKKSKETYMIGFQRLLKCTIDFWKIDEGLKEPLVEINKNKYIQTLYSKRHNLNNPDNDESYLLFCFYKEIEIFIYRDLIPDFILRYNLLPETNLYYEFYYPRENPNYSNDSENIGLDCTDKKDYYYINHIGIYLKSSDIDAHNKFWKELEEKLTNLKTK